MKTASLAGALRMSVVIFLKTALTRSVVTALIVLGSIVVVSSAFTSKSFHVIFVTFPSSPLVATTLSLNSIDVSSNVVPAGIVSSTVVFPGTLESFLAVIVYSIVSPGFPFTP